MFTLSVCSPVGENCSPPRSLAELCRRLGWAVLAVALACAAPLASAQTPAEPSSEAGQTRRPNVVLIMADDIGYECFGCYGSRQYKTPHLDRLAAAGVRMTHCYSQPLCTPSRVKLMTGLSNARNYSAFSVLNRDQRTIGHYFKAAGYRTMVAGKWQLLGAEHYAPQFRGKGTRPGEAGFDESCLWQVDRLGERYAGPLLSINGNNRQFPPDAYGPDLATDAICEFMERHRERPFFAYYPMILVHNPFVPTPDSQPVPAGGAAAPQGKQPPGKQPPGKQPPGRRRRGNALRQRHFEDMVQYMDKLVGRLVAKTEELGIADRTLFVFLGDNGTNQAITSQLGSRKIQGGKGKMTDAGTRVPMICYWPGKVVRGKVSDELVDFSDILPTCLDAAGIPVPDGLDGRSQWPQLQGRRGESRAWIYCYYCPRPERTKPAWFIRDKRWKLHHDGRFIDVAQDPLEQHPLEQLEDEAAAARDRFERALKTLPTTGQTLLKFAEKPAAEEGATSLRAGAAIADITPQRLPVSMTGSFQDRQATAVHDPLRARALVLDDGRAPVALVVCDSCLITAEIFDRAKQLAAKATGISPARMLMSATHTHTAVTAVPLAQCHPDPDYVSYLARQIARAVIDAHAARVPAKVGWAVGAEPREVFNRRWFVKAEAVRVNPFGNRDDRVVMNPPRGSDALLRPAGPVDPAVSLLAVQDRQGQPLSVLANYSLHYVGGIPANQLSADYFGEFAGQLAKKLNAPPTFVGILSNGASGDVNNYNFRQPRPAAAPFVRVREVADRVSQVAAAKYRAAAMHAQVALAMREAELEVGVRQPTAEELRRAQALLDAAADPERLTIEELYAQETLRLAKHPPTVSLKLQALRIGELGIAAAPCELFTQIGLDLKQASPLQPTFVVGLANGYHGYLPTPEQHDLGGYETWRSGWSYLERGASTKIRAKLLELLAEVAEEDRAEPAGRGRTAR